MNMNTEFLANGKIETATFFFSFLLSACVPETFTLSTLPLFFAFTRHH